MLLRSVRQRGAGSAVAWSPTSAPAINSGKIGQYFPGQPYLNVAKSNYSDWSAGTVDANECLATLPNTTTANKTLWQFFGADVAAVVKQGKYWVRWTGPSTNVSVDIVDHITGGTISSVTPVSANVVTFVYTNTSSETNPRVHFTNNTGSSAFSITNFSCVHDDYKTIYDGGEIFSPDLLACLPTHIQAYRFTEWLQIWDSPATSASQIRPEAADAWGAFYDNGVYARYNFYTGVPYAVAAKLAVKLGCDLICPFPLRGDQACYNQVASDLFSVLSAHPTIRVRSTLGNENFDTGHNGNYLNTWGATQSPAISGPEAEAKKLLMVYKALQDAGFPRQQIVRTAELQLYGSWSQPFSGYGSLLLNYVDTAGIIQTGGRFCDLIDLIHTAPYMHMNDGATYPGALHNYALINLDWVNLTDADIRGYFNTDIAEISSTLATRQAELAVYAGRSIPLGCYESGQETVYTYANLSGVYWNFHVDTANNKIVWETSFLPVNFHDGDAWFHQNTFIAPAGNGSNYTGPNPGTCASTIPDGATVYIRQVDANSARFYTAPTGVGSATDTYANDAAAKAASITLDQAFSGQVYTANNSTRVGQFATRMQAYLEGTGGATSYDDLFAAVIGPTKLNYPTQYADLGGYPFSNVYQWWGLKHGVFSADTPRFTAYKART